MGQVASVEIPMSGGLNLVDPYTVLQQQPGQCKQLVNFVPDIYSGYSKIRGYEKWGSTKPTGTTTEIYGVYKYADGVVVVAGEGIYFSTDGDTWLELNRDTWTATSGTVAVVNFASSGAIQINGSGTSFLTDYAIDEYVRIDGEVRKISAVISDTEMRVDAAFSSTKGPGLSIYKNGSTALTGTLEARSGQGQAQIAWYENDGEYGSLIITDTTMSVPPAYLKIEGTGASRTYHYTTLFTDYEAPSTAKWCCVFKERSVLANLHSGRDKGKVVFSERFNTNNFVGAGSGFFYVDGNITGIYPLKDVLIVFTKDSIYQFANIEDEASQIVKPISERVGCVNGFTVQEVAGDLIFLANDGIRTLAASDVYGDISLGSVSRKIDPIVQDIIKASGTHTLTSVYLRSRNQYRIYYSSSGNAKSNQKGLSGTIRKSISGEVEWQWGELEGIPVSAISTSINQTGMEDIYHGDYTGFVFSHDVGPSFDGDNIQGRIVLHEYGYGNQGQRKTLHWVSITGRAEGVTDDFILTIKYDRNDSDTHQPDSYQISGKSSYTVYGTAIYDVDRYSAGREDWRTRVLVEGSGYTNNFEFSTVGTGRSFSIDGIFVDLRVGPTW